MNSKTDINERWHKISQQPKWKYVFIKVPLLRILPLIMVLIIINDILFTYRLNDLQMFIPYVIIKLITSYLLGSVIGHLEWRFIKNIAEKGYANKTIIRNNFLIIYGILSFAGCVIISLISYPYTSIRDDFIMITLWLLSGLVWGWLMWIITFSTKVEKYIKKK